MAGGGAGRGSDTNILAESDHQHTAASRAQLHQPGGPQYWHRHCPEYAIFREPSCLHLMLDSCLQRSSLMGSCKYLSYQTSWWMFCRYPNYIDVAIMMHLQQYRCQNWGSLVCRPVLLPLTAGPGLSTSQLCRRGLAGGHIVVLSPLGLCRSSEGWSSGLQCGWGVENMILR